jgi:hypothetical protein
MQLPDERNSPPPSPQRKRAAEAAQSHSQRSRAKVHGAGGARASDTLPKVVPSLPPNVVIAPMAATAIRAAMRPYSMAVAPDSSATKR